MPEAEASRPCIDLIRIEMLSESSEVLDLMPAFCRARILVLGVGNILFGDDGFGPAVIETILLDYIIPEDIYVMDTGTGVRKLLFTITLTNTRPEEILVVDAVDWGQEIGLVSEIPVKERPATKVDDFSLHHAPTSNLLRDLQDRCGVKITVITCDVGIVPQMIRPGLSPGIQRAVYVASHQIGHRLSLTPVTING